MSSKSRRYAALIAAGAVVVFVAGGASMTHWVRTHAAGAIGAGPPALLGGLPAEGDTRPVYDAGALVGIELHGARPDGFYARLGLRDGDLVQSINGVALDARDELRREVAHAPRVELWVRRRDGAQERIAVPRQVILDGLSRAG